jgi:hypothetical protein
LLRRHPDYRGYACRPLLKDEKVAWGFEPEDIVVECVIRTATWGEISARGRVAATEVEGARERARQSGRKAAPIGTHPVEIAEKRAIARAERAAFGQEAVLDDEEIEEATHVVIAERNDPARVAAGAAAYDRIIAPNYDDDLPDERAEVQPAGAPTPAAEPEDADLVQVARERNESACKEAEEIGVKGVKQLRWAKTDTIEDIERKTFEAEERTRSRNNEIDAGCGSGQRAGGLFLMLGAEYSTEPLDRRGAGARTAAADRLQGREDVRQLRQAAAGLSVPRLWRHPLRGLHESAPRNVVDTAQGADGLMIPTPAGQSAAEVNLTKGPRLDGATSHASAVDSPAGVHAR